MSLWRLQFSLISFKNFKKKNFNYAVFRYGNSRMKYMCKQLVFKLKLNQHQCYRNHINTVHLCFMFGILCSHFSRKARRHRPQVLEASLSGFTQRDFNDMPINSNSEIKTQPLWWCAWIMLQYYLHVHLGTELNTCVKPLLAQCRDLLR